MISLGAGAPSAIYFPFKEVDAKITNPPGFAGNTEETESVIHMAKYDFEPDYSEYSEPLFFSEKPKCFRSYKDRPSCRLELRSRLWLRTDASICDRTY